MSRRLLSLVYFTVVSKTLLSICGALGDLVAQSLLKVALLHECFSRFLNCTNGIKSRNVFHYYHDNCRKHITITLLDYYRRGEEIQEEDDT